jgi:hypothetical protein
MLGVKFYVSLLLPARHRRARVVTRLGRNNRATIVDGVDAVLPPLLSGTRRGIRTACGQRIGKQARARIGQLLYVVLNRLLPGAAC